MSTQDRSNSLVPLLSITDRRTLSELIFTHSLEGMFVTNEDNLIICVNPAFTQITGYSPSDVIGKNPRVLSSGDHPPEFYQKLWHDLNTTGTWKGNITDKKKDGTIYVQRLSICTMFNTGGAVRARLALLDDVTEQQDYKQTIERLAYYDGLTGLPNRSLFLDRLQMAVADADRRGTCIAVMFMDLNRFKQVNDTLGHDAGDKLLIAVANRIKSIIRETDTFARMSGDEFCILLHDVGPATEGTRNVEQLAQKMVAMFDDEFVINGHPVISSISIGIAMHSTDSGTLLAHADLAMYKAKRSGAKHYCFHTE